jgi:signal transduction histidine kinase
VEDAGIAAGWRGEQWLRSHPLVADAVAASALAALLAPTSIWFVWQSGARRADRLLLVGAICLGHVMVVVRRRCPVPAYVVACAVMLVLVFVPDLVPGGRSSTAGQLPPILLPSALVYPVLLYAVAAWTPRPWPAIALAGGLVGAAIATARLAGAITGASGAWARVGDGRLAATAWGILVAAALVATVLAPWGLGRYRAVRMAYIVALEERARRAEAERVRLAEQAVEAERVRIAREMHDIVAHSLVVMVRQAEGGRFAGVQDPGLAIQALTTVADTGREALADMRALLAALRGDGFATESEPQPTLEGLAALVERVRAAGLPLRMTTEGSPRPVHRAVSLAAYRLVQEGLTNVVKHAGPGAEALVSVDWTGPGLNIAVTDTGGAASAGRTRAGHPGGLAAGGGQGLLGMRERIGLAGGRFEAGPARDSGDGFIVRAWLPVRDGEEVL